MSSPTLCGAMRGLRHAYAPKLAALSPLAVRIRHKRADHRELGAVPVVEFAGFYREGPSVSLLTEVQREADPALAAYAVEEPGPGRYEGRLPDPDRAFTVEAVREGFELHYGRPRAFRGMDEDLRLLAGDALYALGLARVADRGDVAAVAELAELISDCARAQAEGRPDVAEARWEAALRALS
jgi:hypothetical protein